MRKLIGFLILCLIVSTSVYVYFNYIKTGAIREVVNQVTPPNKEIKKYLPLGVDLAYPIKIPDGFRMGVFADLGSGRPRVLAQDPNGVIVASVTNEGRVIAMPDKNNDGISDETINILSSLNQPHGILFDQNYLYVAETDKVVRYNYDPKTFKTSLREVLFTLPSGGGHFTRTIKASGGRLYTTVGSSCNVCIEKDEERASMLVSDMNGKNLRVLAKGLRNTVFFTFDKNGEIWGNDMGRDLLGDNLPPDELNIIDEGDYGWPYCYGVKVRDKSFMESFDPNYCTNTKSPVYEHHAHVAPLGITFINSDLFGPSDQGDLLVAYHGSWNSSVPVGYKVVKLNLSGKSVIGQEDFISGFIQGSNVLGRPVDLMFDREGYLYITDDKAGLVYVISKNQ